MPVLWRPSVHGASFRRGLSFAEDWASALRLHSFKNERARAASPSLPPYHPAHNDSSHSTSGGQG
ncbi:MAG: hypothetical protein EOO65_04340 [Methanosarcinales archaeon]|nr:MAG: hypothetical protein EOO65_04340 [Methanosarcinales archaeon]